MGIGDCRDKSRQLAIFFITSSIKIFGSLAFCCSRLIQTFEAKRKFLSVFTSSDKKFNQKQMDFQVKQLIGKNDIHLKARKNKTLSINSLFVVQLER